MFWVEVMLLGIPSKVTLISPIGLCDYESMIKRILISKINTCTFVSDCAGQSN